MKFGELSNQFFLQSQLEQEQGSQIHSIQLSTLQGSQLQLHILVFFYCNKFTNSFETYYVNIVKRKIYSLVLFKLPLSSKYFKLNNSIS